MSLPCIGLDTHLKSWKTTIRVGDTFYKTFSQDPKAEVSSNYLQEHFPGGNYYSAYEAAASFFVLISQKRYSG